MNLAFGRRFVLFLIISANVLLLAPYVHSQIRLPRLISNRMVLQRNINIKLWGWASPNEKVLLTFNKKTYSTVADNSGNWTIILPAQKAGGPYAMTFSGKNKLTVTDILFGDVWVCSGQSNMELTMDRMRDKYAAIMANANNDNIRQFEVPDKFYFEKPCTDMVSGEWLPVTLANIFKFSAVAYFFANNIYTKYKIPIGLINSALGGSPAEAWISEDALKKFPAYYNEAQKFKDKKLIEEIETNGKTNTDNWYSLLKNSDVGLRNNWKSPDVDDSEWNSMKVPGYWSAAGLGSINGAVWFRKAINVPANMVGKPARLFLGRIVDADEVYLNNVFAGSTGYQYPPRRYELPAGVLKEGRNVIAVRVISNAGQGGFVPDKTYAIVTGTDTIDLRGDWKLNIGTKMTPTSSQTFVRWKPLGLYNTMIAPLVNYSIKGVIWYQGEANTKAPTEYTALMQTLITDWRQQWKQGNFPFLFVQLPNFMEPKNYPSESSWAALREAQRKTLSVVPNCGMAVALDLGEWNDIHPLSKKEVGERLALQAEHFAYGNNKIVYAGPLYSTAKAEGNKIVIRFTNVGKGLMAKGGGDLKYFSIADADRKFVWAKAKIIGGNKIMVWNETIDKPVFVRYAWADNPDGANLYNKENLPASPFGAICGQ